MEINKYEEFANRKINYSEDVYFLHYENEFELWLNFEKINSFKTIKELNDYLFNKYLNKRGSKRIYIYTIYFDELYRMFKNIEDEVYLKVVNKKQMDEITAFQIYGGITYRRARYYLGTDKIDKINPANYCELIDKYHNNIAKHSFTTSLRDIIFTEELKKEFGNKENLPYNVIHEFYNRMSLAPIIYSDVNKEYENVYCYDFDSAYISKYFLFKYPTKWIMSYPEDKGATMRRVRIRNVRAKNPRFCCLSLAKRENGTNVVFVNNKSKRVLMAEEVVITMFWFDFEIINEYYEYDEIIYEMAWRATEFKYLPDSFRNIVLNTYKTKEEAKRNKEPYADKKVILNRIHGFFLTGKIYDGRKIAVYPELPVQISFYTIALQRYHMFKLIQQIGLENIVSAHTDSIKTKGNYDAIVKEWNEKYKIDSAENLGQLELEGIMEKVVYFSNTRAKYIEDGKFKIKHGGIWEKDAEDIINNYTYETLQKGSPYNHTTIRSFIFNKDKDCLERIQEIRAFGEACDGDEE